MPGGVLLLSDDQVLIGGGGTTVEILDLVDGSFRVLFDLGRRASFATVSRLSRDRALILGGYDHEIALTELNQIIPLAPTP